MRNALPNRCRSDNVTDLALARWSEIRIICTSSPLKYVIPSYVNPFRLAKLDRILSADVELQPVVAKTRDRRALAGIVQGFLSPDLARCIRVGNLKEGKLTLIADHSAAAAKLQLLAPALIRVLQDRRWQVNSVSLRVQPNGRGSTSRPSQKTVYFSTHAIDRLRELHAGMKPSPARDALAKMLRRHGGLKKD